MDEKINCLGEITIKGKTIPYHVDSIRQTKEFCSLFGIELKDYWSKIKDISLNAGPDNYTVDAAFVYSTLYAGSRRAGVEVDFTYEDVVTWLEDADQIEMAELLKPIVVLLQVTNQKHEFIKKLAGQQA